jgi:3-oxoacyl-[acyl-carrier protein] reductase
MDLCLNGKAALVTCASYGLGFSCAKALSHEGAIVAICSRDRGHINSAKEKIYSITGNKVVGIVADVTKKSDLNQLVDEAQASIGNINILVVSTGHPPAYPFSAATDEHWEKGIDLILRPAITLTRLLINGMREKDYGRIIYIGSIFGLEPEKTSVIQSTLRTGLNALAKCIASEAAPHQITVNVICPGYFDTPLVRKLAKQYADQNDTTVEDVLISWRKTAPVDRFGEPDDLGALVAFLASPYGKFITGTTITIDGGAVRQY